MGLKHPQLSASAVGAAPADQCAVFTWKSLEDPRNSPKHGKQHHTTSDTSKRPHLSRQFQASHLCCNTVARGRSDEGPSKSINRSFSRSSVELCKHRALQSPFAPCSPLAADGWFFLSCFTRCGLPIQHKGIHSCKQTQSVPAWRGETDFWRCCLCCCRCCCCCADQG